MAATIKPAFLSKKSLPYLLLLPTLCWYLFFWGRPVYISVKGSFLDQQGSFTLDHYISVFQNSYFTEALFNTFFLVTVSVFLEFIVAFGLALLINRKFRGSGFFLFVCLLPMALSPVAAGALWKSGFSTYGWVNSLLFNLGFIEKSGKIVFLAGDWGSAVTLIIAIEIWTVVPSVMVILLAGLQGMNRELNEAGYVFGASKFQVLWHITIPLLKPTITTALILRIIAALQIFGIVVLMFGYLRLPTLVEQLVYYYDVLAMDSEVYEIRGLALSVIVSVIISIVVVIYLKISGTTKKD